MEGASKATTATTHSPAASPAGLRNGPATATTQTDQQLSLNVLLLCAERRAAFERSISVCWETFFNKDKAIELTVCQLCAVANAVSVAARAASDASLAVPTYMSWLVAVTASPQPDILSRVAASAGVHHSGRRGTDSASVHSEASARPPHDSIWNCDWPPTA